MKPSLLVSIGYPDQDSCVRDDSETEDSRKEVPEKTIGFRKQGYFVSKTLMGNHKECHSFAESRISDCLHTERLYVQAA